MPGVLVGSNCIIGPNSIVMKNIEDNKLFYTEFKQVVKDRK
jgi:acetyltransferase-like isoleucine patch superfamily enzyme